MQKEPLPKGAKAHQPHKRASRLLPDTPNTRRLAQAMRAATLRYHLLACSSEEPAPRISSPPTETLVSHE
jgi:hypothetical protein